MEIQSNRLGKNEMEGSSAVCLPVQSATATTTAVQQPRDGHSLSAVEVLAETMSEITYQFHCQTHPSVVPT